MTTLQPTPSPVPAGAASSTGTFGGGGERQTGIDVLRGIVMVLMAVDHVRYFTSADRFNPVDLSQTYTALFFTRWITHFCAPGFVFLAGTGAYLYGTRGRSRGDVARFLATRGIWLVVAELTIMRFAWYFNFDYGFVLLGVIWSLGWSMVALSLLVWLPLPAIAAVGVGLIAGHNLIDDKAVLEGAGSGLASLWAMLHVTRPIQLRSTTGLTLFPLIPMIGVMAAGYAFGSLTTLPRARRDRVLRQVGLGLITAFLVLRLTNAYGDPTPWSGQSTAWYTVLSVLNTEKYPMSLLYLLMTLGPAIALLPVLDRMRGPVGRVLLVFGRVPFFYYTLHLLLIHTVAAVLSWTRYGEVIPWLVRNPGGAELPAGYGYNLVVVWLVTAAVVAILYFPCRWFAGVKARRREAWLSYF